MNWHYLGVFNHLHRLAILIILKEKYQEFSSKNHWWTLVMYLLLDTVFLILEVVRLLITFLILYFTNELVNFR